MGQSDVTEHTELCWYLGCCTLNSELSGMTQFKTKGEKHGSLLGLYMYPVLMAADILHQTNNTQPRPTKNKQQTTRKNQPTTNNQHQQRPQQTHNKQRAQQETTNKRRQRRRRRRRL